MVQNQPKIDKKTYLKSYRISLKIFISFLSIFDRSCGALRLQGRVKPGLAWERKEREYFHEKVTSQQRMPNC